MKFLDQKNPNANIMVVPQEEGGTEDDTYFGSIGDATMRHVESLTGAGRQLWEELIHVRSGAIFRIVPSTESNDPDPLNLRNKDLKIYLDKYKGKVSDQSLEAIKEAIEMERSRREKSEDAMDRAELIPFSEWEQNPQMWNHTDIPSTPKDKFIYMGNTTQVFYDSFPEGHPDQNFINNIIQRCDREWCGNDEDIKYAAYLKQQTDEANLKIHTKKFLKEMFDALVSCNEEPSNTIEQYLLKIDEFYSKRYREEGIRKSHTPMHALFETKDKEWTQRFKQGHLVLGEIKHFGKTLYDDKELNGQMTNNLWSKYEELKNKFAPRLLVQGVDINRCNVQELRKVLNLDDLEARNFWHQRPYQSLHQENVAKYLNSSERHHTDNKVLNRILDGLEEQFQKSVSSKSLAPLIQARLKMNTWQQKNSFGLSSSEWNSLWNYYRILKDNIQKMSKVEHKHEQGTEENV